MLQCLATAAGTRLEGEGAREREIIGWTDLQMSSAASTEGPLDVSGPIRGEIVVSLSAALRRHLWLQERTERVRSTGGGAVVEMRRIKVIVDAED